MVKYQIINVLYVLMVVDYVIILDLQVVLLVNQLPIHQIIINSVMLIHVYFIVQQDIMNRLLLKHANYVMNLVYHVIHQAQIVKHVVILLVQYISIYQMLVIKHVQMVIMVIKDRTNVLLVMQHVQNVLVRHQLNVLNVLVVLIYNQVQLIV